jgi:Flp pilus assembly protein TadD
VIDNTNTMHEPKRSSLHQLALLAIDERRMEDAVHLLRAAIREKPSSDALWNDLGVVMEALGNPSKAGDCYAVALNLNPDHPEARGNLANLKAQLHMRELLKQKGIYAVMSRMAAASGAGRTASAS